MGAIRLTEKEADEILGYADTLLGDTDKKSGRYHYKNNHRCDFAIVREADLVTIFCSGGLRFRTTIKTLSSGKKNVSISSIGAAQDYSVNKLIDIIGQYTAEVEKGREKRRKQEQDRKDKGEDKPGFSEPIGFHFSIKASDSRIKKDARISFEKSEQNFELAKRSATYHGAFITFCIKHKIKCYYRAMED